MTDAPAPDARRASVALRALGAAAVLTPFTVLIAWGVLLGSPDGPGEFHVFGPAGRALLTGHVSDVFANSAVQAGVLELAPYGLGSLLSAGPVGWFAFYAVFSWLGCWGIAAAVLAVAGAGRAAWLAALGAAGLAVVSGAVANAAESGHPAHVAIPVLWVLGAVCARRGRGFAAGLLVGVATGFESWGLLGVAVLLLVPWRRPLPWRALGRAALGVLLALALLYLPFVANREFATGDYTWLVSPDTVPGLVVEPGTPVGWSLRIAQGGIAIAAGAITVLATRRLAVAPWAVALAIIAARLLIDPLLLPYYTISAGLVLVALGAVATVVAFAASKDAASRAARVIPGALLAAAGLVEYLVVPRTSELAGAVGLAAVALTVVVACGILAARRRRAADSLRA